MQSENLPFHVVILVSNIATNVDTIFTKIAMSHNFIGQVNHLIKKKKKKRSCSTLLWF